ncbi:L,D-transpeptidase family protein [Nocardioides speluncae]|uniref:L,D-transpeptidase family protein n=1 Tax=Nocardioides speluncae TaxID=2670337 RepID=UPI001F0C43B8|nr:L,D-transpeptidase family protein [Nocardioides speluncae]
MFKPLAAVIVAAITALTLGVTLAPAQASAPASASAPAQASAQASASAGIKRAQKRLNTLRCSAGPVDGSFGTWTKSAVIRFQSRHGFAQNGRLDRVTVNRLYSTKARRCNVRPVPSGTGTGRRIVLARKQNWLWLVRADGTVAAQGGVVDNPNMPPGTYRTGSYCGRAARIKLNRDNSKTLWLDNFVRWAPCGFGFHGIPRYISNGAPIHADYILGTNLNESHGCVRMSKALSQRVWDFTERATKVVLKG